MHWAANGTCGLEGAVEVEAAQAVLPKTGKLSQHPQASVGECADVLSAATGLHLSFPACAS
jgi:hypothetical protein